MPDTLYEHLNDNSDTQSQNCYGVYWLAQTFTSDTTHLIDRVCLKGCHEGIVEKIATIGIQAVDGLGRPDGADLTWVTFSTHLFKLGLPCEWKCIDLPPLLLTAGVMYAIVFRVPTAGVGDRLVFRRTLDSGYPNGRAWNSTTGGVTWTGNARWCHQFEEWGNLPAPPPPIGPPEKWACLSLVETCLADGYSFLAMTNKPCHLWLRTTDAPTRIHLASEERRGETKMTDLKFCFTQFSDIEQEEAGDTLEHTFIVRNWLRWLFNEPWGDTLQENNTWEALPDYDPPPVTISNGLCTVHGKAILGQYLRTPYYGGLWPLISPTGDHLYFYHSSPATVCNPVDGFLAYQLITYNAPDKWVVEPTIDRGNFWGPWGTNTFADATHGGSDIGKGPGIIDFTAYWIMLRTLGGLDADPAGWTVNPPWLALEQLTGWQPQSITNDYMALSYNPNIVNPQTPSYIIGDRNFYLLGTIDEVATPSTSNLFKYHFPPKPYRNQLFGQPTSSDRAYSDQGVYAIFIPPVDYTLGRIAACLALDSAEDPPVYPDKIFLDIREAPALDECGPLVYAGYIFGWDVPIAPVHRWLACNVPGIKLKKAHPYAFVVRSSLPFGATGWGSVARIALTECIMNPILSDSFVAANPCQQAVGFISPLMLASPRSVGVPSTLFVI